MKNFVRFNDSPVQQQFGKSDVHGVIRPLRRAKIHNRLFAEPYLERGASPQTCTGMPDLANLSRRPCINLLPLANRVP